MDDGDEKFVLEYHTADDPDPQGPPFKYRSHYLDDVVAEASRLTQSKGRALRITRGESIVFDRDALEGILKQVSALKDDEPNRPLRELAKTVVEERDEG